MNETDRDELDNPSMLDDIVRKIKESENQYVILAREHNIFVPESYLRFEDTNEEDYQFEKHIEDMFPEYFV